MYSSQWQGITNDPDLMVIPIDDHLVHRGDGAFEVIRCVGGKIYQLEQHLKRLENSLKAIFLDPPKECEDIREIIRSMVILGGKPDCLIRIFISRGPGSFGIDPYDCPARQIYIILTRFKAVPYSYYQQGVRLITSHIPIKQSFFANIKSCNYLPNVLMKKEAIDKDCKFCVALDEDGFLAEGPTENIGVLTSDGILRFPGFERTLSGITVKRVIQLARDLVDEGLINDVVFTKISVQDAYKSKEIFLTGTSVNVIPVVKYDNKIIGEGIPGPVYQKMSKLLNEDMLYNNELLTDLDMSP